jgi:carboxylesterase type B
MELTYVFGDWDDTTGWWDSIAGISRSAGVTSPRPKLDATDRQVSETIMELWSSFARTGKPKAKGIPVWPEYNRATDRYLYISGKSEIRTGFMKIVRS